MDAGAAVENRDRCRKCGEWMAESLIRNHLRWCTSEEWVIPPGMDQCRKCEALIPGRSRNRHEKACRGSAILNRTCSKCSFVFPPSNDN
eukprot:6859373-Alexandrium_andersonii.AAC.1